MTTRRLLVLAFCGALLLGPTFAFAEKPKPLSGRFGLTISVEPAKPGTGYVCAAEITDLADGRVLSAPTVTVQPDQDGTARTGALGGGTDYDLVITFRVSPGSVRYVFTAKQGSQVVARQEASIKL